MITLELVGLDKGAAATLLQRLRLQLSGAGLPPEELTISQKDKNAMSVGDILQIVSSLDVIALTHKTLEVALIVKSIYEFVHRNRVTISFDADGKKLEISPSNISAKELQAALEKAATDDGPRA